MFRAEGSSSANNSVESVEGQAGTEPLTVEVQQNDGIFFGTFSRYEYMINLEKWNCTSTITWFNIIQTPDYIHTSQIILVVVIVVNVFFVQALL